MLGLHGGGSAVWQLLGLEELVLTDALLQQALPHRRDVMNLR